MQETLRDMGLIPGLGRSLGGGHGNPLHYSCLENPMNRGAWWTAVHVVAKNGTRLKRLSTHTCAHTHEKITIGTNVSVAESQWHAAGHCWLLSQDSLWETRGVSKGLRSGKSRETYRSGWRAWLGSLFPCLASHGLCNLGEFPWLLCVSVSWSGDPDLLVGQWRGVSGTRLEEHFARHLTCCRMVQKSRLLLIEVSYRIKIYTSHMQWYRHISKSASKKRKLKGMRIPRFDHLRLCVCACPLSPILCNSLWPHGLYSPPGSSVHGISQARILEWVAIIFSRGSSQPRDQTCISCISCIGGQVLYQLSHQGKSSC